MPRFLCDLGMFLEKKLDFFSKIAKMRGMFESFVK